MAPKSESSGNIKSSGKTLPTREKKISKKRKETFAGYIFKVLRQVHPSLGISSKGMKIMTSFVDDILEKMANEAASLVKLNNRRTLTSREFRTATRLLLPGELSKHAVAEGTKGLALYVKNS
ncbi:hypothetical protein LAZ67_11000301 [Cordylochernes scorpioides]|uniref:Core Histone H2A/H2B/H3 domain-containing protein n=1 Tax=Cordylochernes scorpioides TaxID=51811 RepID=A0ABY6KXR6_9ARAC|nr:hypothetical protein LAZ67_11000301 [Cordylochernes scorpioides]